MIRITHTGLQTRITQKNMAGISVSKICVPFGGGGVDWSTYCTPLIVEEETAEYFITEEGDYLIAEE